MTPFEKLVNRILVHEAFDKPYPAKIPRTKEEIRKAKSQARDDYSASLDRKELYAFPRMSEQEREDFRDEMYRANARRRSNLDEEEDLADEKIIATINSHKSNLELKNEILDKALKRQGSPKKEYIGLPPIEKLVNSVIRSQKENVPSVSTLFSQVFDAKDSLIRVNLSLKCLFKEILKPDGTFLRYELNESPTNGLIDISFKAAGGSYADVTGSNDASRIVATVMEFAFAVFSVWEKCLEMFYPKFLEYKKQNTLPVISFSGMGNYGGINLQSKTAKEGINKRNRLYSLGWRSFQKQRGITDLQLNDHGHGTIYINYK